MVLLQQSNMLIRIAEAVDNVVIGVKVLKQSHRLKIHGMSLDLYLGPENVELLRKEIKL